MDDGAEYREKGGIKRMHDLTPTSGERFTWVLCWTGSSLFEKNWEKKKKEKI